MLDLKPQYLAILRDILAKHVPGKIVWAYGSRVNGTAYEASDLDLVVLNLDNASVTQKNLAALRTALSESNLPILIDVLDWASIPEKFREEIKRNYEVIQE